MQSVSGITWKVDFSGQPYTRRFGVSPRSNGEQTERQFICPASPSSVNIVDGILSPERSRLHKVVVSATVGREERVVPPGKSDASDTQRSYSYVKHAITNDRIPVAR